MAPDSLFRCNLNGTSTYSRGISVRKLEAKLNQKTNQRKKISAKNQKEIGKEILPTSFVAQKSLLHDGSNATKQDGGGRLRKKIR